MSLKLICWVGHYAKHGDQHGRSKATVFGADQGIFGRDIGGGISGSKSDIQLKDNSNVGFKYPSFNKL
jgi:hypothetical protein